MNETSVCRCQILSCELATDVWTGIQLKRLSEAIQNLSHISFYPELNRQSELCCTEGADSDS